MGAAQHLQEIDKAALVGPRRSSGARAIHARRAARRPQFGIKIGKRRAAVSVAVFSRFAIYANVVRPADNNPVATVSSAGVCCKLHHKRVSWVSRIDWLMRNSCGRRAE